MASLFNTKISNTYVGLIKTIDNAVISASLRELTDGSGNQTGVYLNNAGDFKASGTLEFGSLKDTGENITITKFVDEADGIASNDNDTTIPTSAAVVDYVAARITLEDLDFSGDSGTGSVDLDSQTFAVVGTANEIETSAGSQQLQIGLPDNVTIGGNLQVNGLLKGNNNIVVKDTSDRTMAAFYGGNKAELYFNDSKKFETTSDGATVTGGLTATGGSVFTGATFSSNVIWADSAEAAWGANQDFTISHIAGDNYLSNDIGNLYIRQRANDGDILFQNDDGSGGVTTYFYVDGSGTRTIFEKLTRHDDNVYAAFGSDSDLRILHDGSDSFINQVDSATGDLYIQQFVDDKDIIFKADDGSGGMAEYFRLDGGVTKNVFSKDINLTNNIQLQLGSSAQLDMYHTGSNAVFSNDTGNFTIENAADDSDIIFKCDDGSGGTTEYFRLDGSVARVEVSKSFRFSDNIQANFGSSGDLGIYHNGTNSYILNGTGDLEIINNNDNGDISFISDNGSGSTTEYFRVDGGIESLVASKDLLMAIDGNGGKIKFGASQDLEIFHDGSNSYIKDNGTGNLLITSDGASVQINKGLTENMAEFITDGAVNLYYDSAKKFETTSTGVTITGVAVADGLDMGDSEQIRLGASQDLLIFHDGSHSYIKAENTGDLYVQSTSDDVVIQGADDVFIYTQGGEDAIIARGDGGVQLFYNAVKKLETKNGGVDVLGTLDATGNISVSNASPTLTLTDTDNSNDITFNSVGGALVLNSTSDQVFQIGGVEKFRVGSTTATFAGSVTIAQDLTINGTTTTVNTSTLAVEDPLISMAKDNSANSVDIGFYGRYNDGSNRYLGLFADASDSNTFNLFKGTTTEPTTTVDTTATGYTLADLNVGNVALGDNTKITFGAVPDFEIYHNSSTNVNHIQSLLDRQLALNGNTIFLRNQDNDTNFLQIDSTDASFGGNVKLADSKEILIGNSSDLKIYHNGSNSYIENYTSDLIISNTADDADVRFFCDDGSGGTTEYFKLDGSQKKTIVSVEFNFIDDVYATFGTGRDLRLINDGSNNFFESYNHNLYIDQNFDDGDIVFRNDNGSGGKTTYMTIDGGDENIKFAKNTKYSDNVKALFGSGSDLEIYHDGSNSYINENGTGVLAIQTNGTEIQFNSTGGEYLARFIPDSSVKLYYDNAEKIQTTSTGVEVTGQITFGDSHTIGDDADNNLKIASSSNENIIIDSSDDIILDAGGDDFRFKVNGTEFAKFDNSSSNLNIYSSIQDKDIKFLGNDGGSTITALTLDMSNGGSASFADDVDLGDDKKLNLGASADLKIYHSGGASSYIENGSGDFYIMQRTLNGNLVFQCDDGSGGDATYFQLDGGSSATNELYTKFPDYSRLAFGNGLDLKIWHDASHSYIQDAGTGSLKVGAANWHLMNSGLDEYMMTATPNEGVILYYNNGEKFKTTTTGVNVVGNLGIGDNSADYSIEINHDNPQIRLEENTTGGSKRLDLKVNTSTSNAEIGANQSAQGLILQTTGSDRLTIRSDGRIGIGNAGYSSSTVGINAGTDDDAIYATSTDANCFATFRDTNSTSNVAYGARGDDHVLRKDNADYFIVNNVGDVYNYQSVNKGNTFYGYAAGDYSAAGGSNTFMGYNVANNLTSGTQNVGIGRDVFISTLTGSSNTAIGTNAAQHITSGNNNVAVGFSALETLTEGTENTAVGWKSLEAATTSSGNTAVGLNSLTSTTVGDLNVAVGTNALRYNVNGDRAVAIGYNALQAQAPTSANTDTYNVAIGLNSQFSVTTGTFNTTVGGYTMANGTDSSYNVAVGYGTLHTNITGDNNVAVGYNAGHYLTSANNTIVGHTAGDEITTGDTNLVLGYAAGSGSSPFQLTTQSNRIILGSNAATDAYIKIDWTVTSDKRDKTDFEEIPIGLDFVNKLKPTEFKFRKNRNTEETDGKRRYGFIAQEILELEGENSVIIDAEQEDDLKYKQSHLVPVLVKAIQELKAEVDSLKKQCECK